MATIGCSPKKVDVSPTESQTSKEESREETSQNCTICFEPWTNSSKHRLVSLRCGHLFGQSCISHWLESQNARCPQCNASARMSEIRNIYAKAVKVIDCTNCDKAMQDLQEEKDLKEKAIQDLQKEKKLNVDAVQDLLKEKKRNFDAIQDLIKEKKLNVELTHDLAKDKTLIAKLTQELIDEKELNREMLMEKLRQQKLEKV